MAKTSAETRTLKDFGGNVRRERVAQNLTQECLAEAADLHPRTLQKIERGDIDILLTTIRRIQAALACPWEALFGPGAKSAKAPVRAKTAKRRRRVKS